MTVARGWVKRFKRGFSTEATALIGSKLVSRGGGGVWVDGWPDHVVICLDAGNIQPRSEYADLHVDGSESEPT